MKKFISVITTIVCFFYIISFIVCVIGILTIDNEKYAYYASVVFAIMIVSTFIEKIVFGIIAYKEKKFSELCGKLIAIEDAIRELKK